MAYELNYTQPGTNTNAQYSDFYKNNTWANMFQPGVDNATKLGNKFLNRRLQFDPLAGGAEGMRKRFGYTSGVNPNDPNIPAWMANLEGTQRNFLDSATKQFAGAGVASSRGGMGVAGGPSADSVLQNNAMKTLASGAADNYGRAVDWTFKNDATANQNASALADMYSKVYSADLNTGQGLLGQALQGTQSADSSRNAWARMMDEAFNKDTDYAKGSTDRDRARMMWEQQQRDAQQQRDKQSTLQQMMRQAFMGAPNTGYSPYEDDLARAEYLKQSGLIPKIGGGGRSTGKKSSGAFDPTTLASSRDLAASDSGFLDDRGNNPYYDWKTGKYV